MACPLQAFQNFQGYIYHSPPAALDFFNVNEGPARDPYFTTCRYGGKAVEGRSTILDVQISPHVAVFINSRRE